MAGNYISPASPLGRTKYVAMRLRSMTRVIGPRAALLAGLSLAPSIAPAQSADFAGRWSIVTAIIAPWAVPGRVASGGREAARLIGKTITFGREAVVGPEPLGCAKPVYVTRGDGADMLFEGGLAEDAAGKPRDAATAARSIGMTTPMVITLETGCSEISYHRLAPDKLAFGLNDRIYYLNREGSAARR